MILEFSRPLIGILLFCFFVLYKYFCRKELLINFILDLIVGTMILVMAEIYFTDQIKNFGGHGSAMLSVINFIYFSLLYVISTSFLYWKKSKISSLILPIFLYSLVIFEFLFLSGISKLFWKSTLIAILCAFFPIYLINYFRIFYINFNHKEK